MRNPTRDDDVVRRRSKELLGGQYRAEVAAAIGRMGMSPWTMPELVRALPDAEPAIPPSCVNREVQLFLSWDLVERVGKTQEGHFQYLRTEWSGYWQLADALTQSALPASRKQESVTPMRKRRAAR